MKADEIRRRSGSDKTLRCTANIYSGNWDTGKKYFPYTLQCRSVDADVTVTQ